MTQNPFINAGAAFAYIAALVLGVFFILGPVEHTLPEGLQLLIPMVAISVFTLSAAVMGYLFLYQPILLILDNRRAEGTTLFLKTVGAFAALVLVLGTALVLLG